MNSLLGEHDMLNFEVGRAIPEHEDGQAISDHEETMQSDDDSDMVNHLVANLKEAADQHLQQRRDACSIASASTAKRTHSSAKMDIKCKGTKNRDALARNDPSCSASSSTSTVEAVPASRTRKKPRTPQHAEIAPSSKQCGPSNVLPTNISNGCAATSPAVHAVISPLFHLQHPAMGMPAHAVHSQHLVQPGRGVETASNAYLATHQDQDRGQATATTPAPLTPATLPLSSAPPHARASSTSKQHLQHNTRATQPAPHSTVHMAAIFGNAATAKTAAGTITKEDREVVSKRKCARRSEEKTLMQLVDCLLPFACRSDQRKSAGYRAVGTSGRSQVYVFYLCMHVICLFVCMYVCIRPPPLPCYTCVMIDHVSRMNESSCTTDHGALRLGRLPRLICMSHVTSMNASCHPYE